MFFMCIPLIGSVVWFFYGSFEMFPNKEADAKARIVSGFFFLAFLIVEVLLFFAQRKIKKRMKKQTPDQAPEKGRSG
jgi:hypothetical protein